MGKKAAVTLEQGIDGHIGIGRVAVVFFNRIMLHDLSVTGEYGDTLAYIGKLSVSFSGMDLLGGKLHANRITVEDGYFNLCVETPDKRNNIQRIFRIDKKADKREKPMSLPEMSAGVIRLRNLRFDMTNPFAGGRHENPDAIDFTRLKVEKINARLVDAEYSGGVLSCNIRNLSCKEECGYEAKSIKGFFSMTPSVAKIEELSLTDSYSNISAGVLSFSYGSGKDLKDFVHKIAMSADFQNSTLDMRSICVFAHKLDKIPVAAGISGKVSGTVSDLRTDGLHITYKDSTRVYIAASIQGLPEIENTVFDIDIKDIATTPARITGIMKDLGAETGKNPLAVIPGNTRVRLNASVYGTIDSLMSEGLLTTGIGNAGYKATMDRNGKSTDIRAEVDVMDIEAGILAGTSRLGKASATVTASIALRDSSAGGLRINVDTLSIGKLMFNEYDYSGIIASGTFDNGTVDARILSRNRNLSMMMQVIYRIRDIQGKQRMRMYLNVPQADLKATNLIKGEDMSVISFLTKADITMDNERNLLGSIAVDNISYTNGSGRYTVDSLYVNSAIEDGKYVAGIHSNVLNAIYASTDPPALLPKKIRSMLIDRHFPSLATDAGGQGGDSTGHGGHYFFRLTTLDTDPICQVLLNGLKIADSTTVRMEISGENMECSLLSESISLKNNSVQDISISLGNTPDSAACDIRSSCISVAGIDMRNSLIRAVAGNGRIDFGYSFQDSVENSDFMHLSASAYPRRSGSGDIRTDISLDKSTFSTKGHVWEISPSTLTVGKNYYNVNGLGISNKDQKLGINGTLSDRDRKGISVNMENFDISILNSFIKGKLDAAGILSGYVNLLRQDGNLGAQMSLECSGLSLSGNQLGEISILSRWDNSNRRFALMLTNDYMNYRPLNVRGYYSPGRNFLSLDASAYKLEMSHLSPFLEKYLTISSGTLSGDFSISGQPDSPGISSNNIRLDSIRFTPAYTKVPYILDGGLTMTERGIELAGTEITDENGNKASLSGMMTHRNFRNIYLDTRLAFERFKCLNTTEADNSSFYGQASASGIIAMTGYTDRLTIDAQISTGENTAIHIPLSSASSASSTNLITFVNGSDSLDADGDGLSDTPAESAAASTGGNKKKKGEVSINVLANVTQDAEVLLEINKQLGDIMRCRGNGNIDISLNPSRNIFDLRGDYTVSEGNYHLVLLGITSKDFIINEGGSIAFNGNIRNTNMNVGATYRTKASISTLIADTTSVSNRRTVDCGIQLRGPLTNPEISFSIDIPDLDPITKGRVESALSTADKIQKQFMALIFSGSFVPDEQSGIVNNTTVLYSNASEILSNQFNNIFRQLDIPLDLGFNYQPGSGYGNKDLFDMSLSYQAFNNRLVINGNIGNSQTSSDPTGDFEAEFKVDKQGKLRITVFTRSADTYSNYLDNTQRNGFGITFQDEFDTFGDFWRNLFYSKKRKEEYEIEQLRKAVEELEAEAEAANIKKEQILRPKEDAMGIFNENGAYIEYTESDND